MVNSQWTLMLPNARLNGLWLVDLWHGGVLAVLTAHETATDRQIKSQTRTWDTGLGTGGHAGDAPNRMADRVRGGLWAATLACGNSTGGPHAAGCWRASRFGFDAGGR